MKAYLAPVVLSAFALVSEARADDEPISPQAVQQAAECLLADPNGVYLPPDTNEVTKFVPLERRGQLGAAITRQPKNPDLIIYYYRMKSGFIIGAVDSGLDGSVDAAFTMADLTMPPLQELPSNDRRVQSIVKKILQKIFERCGIPNKQQSEEVRPVTS